MLPKPGVEFHFMKENQTVLIEIPFEITEFSILIKKVKPIVAVELEDNYSYPESCSLKEVDE